MNPHLVCLVAVISLALAVAGSQWEVINDVKPYDDSGSQDDLLSEEEFIPLKVKRSKPAPLENVKVQKMTKENVKVEKMTKAPLLLVKPERKGGDNNVGEDELLPLGVVQRRLLQSIGPSLPPQQELQRQRLKSGAVNLSTVCKDLKEEDCLSHLDNLLAKQLPTATTARTTPDSGKETVILLSRHKRQNGNPSTPDPIEEGSGTTEDSLYDGSTSSNAGMYRIDNTMATTYPDQNPTKEELSQYREELQRQLENAFRGMPGYAGIEVGQPVLVNGTMITPYTVLVDGGKAANEVGEENLEESILGYLRNISIPAVNGIKINGQGVAPGYQLGNDFLNRVTDTLFNYCRNVDKPCGDTEYDPATCVNDGFMSGTCWHKCKNYGCKNDAICELTGSYQPFCVCGKRYSGQFCEVRQDVRPGLTLGEKVGVGVAATVGCLALLSCCFYLLCCCRRKHGVRFTYYEDDCVRDNVSDPTSICNYYIDRPIISQAPISVFNSSRGFDACDFPDHYQHSPFPNHRQINNRFHDDCESNHFRQLN